MGACDKSPMDPWWEFIWMKVEGDSNLNVLSFPGPLSGAIVSSPDQFLGILLMIWCILFTETELDQKSADRCVDSIARVGH